MMMSSALSLLLAGVFAILALIHVYWACGGSWGKAAAVPERDGAPAFKPSKIGTLLVAAALSCAAGIVGVFGNPSLPVGLTVILALPAAILTLILLARAIGDFRLVGFFKRPSESRFARQDTRVYSPLCLALSLGVAALIWLQVFGR